MSKNKSPWLWVPTLYFAEGIPYFIVNVVSVTMFKRMGMGNADLAMYTSLLYLPWVIKPLWSPLVDVVRTKRWWIVVMQALMTLCFAAIALSLPRRTGAPVGAFVLSLIFFYITAMLSATHDIAADGYYMLALDEHRQSLFVGIRSTFYRIASVFGQGVIVVVAGLLENRYGDIPEPGAPPSWPAPPCSLPSHSGISSFCHQKMAYASKHRSAGRHLPAAPSCPHSPPSSANPEYGSP